MQVTAERPIDVVADVFNVEPAKLAPQLGLASDLGADSIDRLGLAIALERRCGIPVADREIQRAATIADVVELVAPERD